MARLNSDEAVLRRGRVLLGHMSEDEAQAFVVSQSAEDWAEIRPKWAKAVEAKQLFPAYNPGDRPQLQPMPSETEEYSALLKASPAFQQTFAGRQADFGLIEVDRLVAFQQFVDTQFSDAAGEARLPKTDPLEAIRMAFPLEVDGTLSGGVDPSTKSVTLSSLNRTLNVTNIEIRQNPNEPLTLVFSVQVGMNWIMVSTFEGRMFLQNGYHRSWLLRRSNGLVPCVVTTARSFTDVGAGPGFFSPALLLSDRPPMFGQFATDGVAVPLMLKSTMRVVRVAAAEFVVPRLP